jgi:hypothetical protein
VPAPGGYPGESRYCRRCHQDESAPHWSWLCHWTDWAPCSSGAGSLASESWTGQARARRGARPSAPCRSSLGAWWLSLWRRRRATLTRTTARGAGRLRQRGNSPAPSLDGTAGGNEKALSGEPKRAKKLLKNYGIPNGIRTRVTNVKGWCPRPLDDGDKAICAHITVGGGY